MSKPDDVTEKYKKAFDPLNEHASPAFQILEWAYVTWYLIFLFMPPLCAGKLATCSNKIIEILHDKLLDNGDERTTYEIVRFIEYVRARPFQFTVYKLVPLNEQLLGMVLQFCVTYLIVIVQFTVKL